MTHPLTVRPRHLVAYLALSMIWGLSFLFMLRVVTATGLVGAVALRALVAAATLGMAAWLTGRRLTLFVHWREFSAVGATTVVGQLAALSFATHEIGTAMTAILIGTIPIFSMLLAHAGGYERITPRRVGGVLLAILGLVLLVGFPAVSVTPRFLFGCFLAVVGSFCAAFGSNYAAAKLRGVDPLSMATGTFLAGGLLGLPLYFLDPIRAWPGLRAILDLLVLGCVISALAYVIYFWLVGAIGPTRAISVEFVVNLNGALIGVVFLGEPLSMLQVLGAMIVLAGCAIVLDLSRAFRGRG